ncbi:acyl-CoA thioesterase [Pseudorhodoplanes sinuspersici]|uniref:Uncharacterized protein n=1 Tax=Pseudorhodoplanes sinuspersici TaxID=1235591 RepID=A0A1W6ZMS4_9HYPH|nr:acyl-CoA thioesterase [Pseudorhodoplanes sinuspersici]ARP98713.1 hypothetical protein CAK95_06190 [Pseudorhodoplanes sinuspersici]RKE69686.1 4-hydroxybenzoyl-CoA thioesterase [Pseudorhodoplanes sinuspersici]
MLSYSRSLQIEWGDCDPAGIVFYPRYFAMFDHNTTMLISKASGLTKPQLLKHYDFAGYPVLSTQAKFMIPNIFGDTVEIESTFTRVGRSSFEIRHELKKGVKIAVEANEVRAWVKGAADDKTRIKSHPLPEDLAAKFRGE